MTDNRWLYYAILAAVSAALVGIFAKIGMKEIDSTVATTVRSAVMLLFLLCVCTAQGLWHHLPKIRGWAVVMIALSGLAGATSWLFGFKALAVGGEVTQVAPIDKLSVPLAAVLAFLFLRDRPSAVNWAGIVLIALGAYLASLPRSTQNGAGPTTTTTTASAAYTSHPATDRTSAQLPEEDRP